MGDAAIGTPQPHRHLSIGKGEREREGMKGRERERRRDETGFGHANNGCYQDDDAVSHSPNRRPLFSFPSLSVVHCPFVNKHNLPLSIYRELAHHNQQAARALTGC